MKVPGYSNDANHWFLGELTSRIVVESGIPSDRYHLGKILLQSLKDAPDFLMQIDGGTDKRETNRSALERTLRCANAMKAAGLKVGDVIVLMAPNHIDLVIPFFAALYLGVIVAAVDRTLGVQEILASFNINKPRMVFCQSEKVQDIQLALNGLELDTLIITFDNGDLCSFDEFLERGMNGPSVDEFRPTDFNPEDTIGFLVATSGTTSLPKSAAVTHKSLVLNGPYFWSRFNNFPTPTELALIVAPLQWLTALVNFCLSTIYRFTRLQSSMDVTQKHAYHLINTYKPTFTICSPTLMTTLIKPGDRDQCDFTCFDLIMLGGSAVPQDLIEEIKKIAPETEAVDIYGMSELVTIAFQGGSGPSGSSGKPVGCFQYRLVNVDTQEDIFEPGVPGELWLKGPGIFKEYYNDPKTTAEAFAEGRWFKTGDMFYRDENCNFFFVEKMKLLLKYRNHQVSPVEIESVIRQHPGILDAAVIGIPDKEYGDLPVACVVKRLGHNITAQEIKDLVKESLADTKQLRGGVIFLDEIPMTSSTKLHRRKLKEIALKMVKI